MQAYRVSVSGPDNVSKTRYFWINYAFPVDGDTQEKDMLLLREDYKFAVYCRKVYRVCQVKFDDDRPFIKVWEEDPFKGFPDYEQIVDEPETPEYSI